MNTDCPKCGSENAFFNGVCWECPDCDYEWEEGDDDDIYGTGVKCPRCGNNYCEGEEIGNYYVCSCGECGYSWKEELGDW